VSARANVLAIESELPGAALLRTLNGIAPEIYFTAAAPISPDFRIRAATRRTYRYFEPPGDQRLAVWRRACRWFVGDVDVRSFGRAIDARAALVRTIESIRVDPVGGGFEVEITAPSFVWNEVRKIVAALRWVDAGRLTEERLRAALRGTARLTLPLAEPERLILWDMELPIEWTTTWSGPNRQQTAHLADQRAFAWTRDRILDALPPPTRHA
jgi:tRNA pseudouridine(38-40) synthase